LYDLMIFFCKPVDIIRWISHRTSCFDEKRKNKNADSVNTTGKEVALQYSIPSGPAGLL